MKTQPKTFDAVAASRQWREETSRMLDAMPMAERVAFLKGLREQGTGRDRPPGGPAGASPQFSRISDFPSNSENKPAS